jgi:cobyrinic acid a,c-diamide synthase
MAGGSPTRNLQPPRSCPAILVSAPSSGQGKTSITAALAYLHRQAGKHVRVFKIGPDFLDPMILERASGNPVYQLDLWMTGESECRKLLYEAAVAADLILVEGVMGLFDGKPSSADLAQLFDIPVVAVIDASSMAQTFNAIAHGLKSFRLSLPFSGVIANNVASARHAEMLLDGTPKGMNYFGFIPRKEQFTLPSRHLGLMQAKEILDLDNRLASLAESLKATDLSTMPVAIQFKSELEEEVEPLLRGIRIGVARDLAFSFLYHANLDLLNNMGASLVFFSPLTDRGVPACDSLYFPGGYPELYLQELEENISMKESILAHFKANRPIYAECGGMLYMLDSLTDKNGYEGKMLGLISGRAFMLNRLKGLGYQLLDSPKGEVRGHTFHHSESTINLQPSAYAKRVSDGQTGEPLYKVRNLTATYLHLYFPSNPMFVAQAFLPQNISFLGKSPTVA